MNYRIAAAALIAALSLHGAIAAAHSLTESNHHHEHALPEQDTRAEVRRQLDVFRRTGDTWAEEQKLVHGA